MKLDEKRLSNMMDKLDITREEAIAILRDDERIDKGEKLFELTAEQKQAEKKARSTGTKAVYTFTKRERKPNEIKGNLIEFLENALKNSDFEIENVEITNKERQIAFKIGENDFELTLIQKRKPKK